MQKSKIFSFKKTSHSELKIFDIEKSTYLFDNVIITKILLNYFHIQNSLQIKQKYELFILNIQQEYLIKINKNVDE